jgi:hypothetical protein
MTAQERLEKFIRANLHGGCKMLSMGDGCECPLCDFDRIVHELHWYGSYAEGIAKDFDKNTDGILAAMTVFKLDAGKRSKI